MAHRNIASLIKDQQKTCRLSDREGQACYRLLTHREYLDGNEWKPQDESTSDEQIRRWRFGHVNPEKIKKSTLIVGETGTGKTTLINAMVNYMLGVKYEDKVWFEITEEQKKSQAESQTSAITVYDVNIDDSPISLTIIDTPGYGTTGPKGAIEDKMIAKKMLQLFTAYADVERICSVGLVVKASENRLTESQQYIFDAVLSIFGRNLESNIVIFVTHSDGDYPENALNAVREAQIPCAKDADGHPVHFLFNNKLRQTEKTQKKQYKHSQKDTSGDWKMGKASMKDFFDFLSQAEEKTLRMTEDVLKQRELLEACIINLQQRILAEEKEQKKLEQIEAVLQANKEKLDNNENFEFEVEEVYKKAVPIADVLKTCKEQATRCNNCKENCHFPGCTWVSKDKLWRCEVMQKGENGDYLCKVCNGHCSYKKHVKDEKMFVQVSHEVKRTASDLKKMYEEKYGEGVDVKARIEENLHQSKMEQQKLVEEAYNHIMQLQEIALRKEPRSIVVLLDFLISRLQALGQSDKAEKLRDIKMRVPPVSTGTKTFYQSLISLRKMV